MTRLHVPIKLRWSDLDAYGHVNNAAMLTLLEETRISVFWHGDLTVDGVSETAGGPQGDTLTLIGRQEVEYLAAIPYGRDPLDVQMWIGRMGGASLDVCYEVCSPEGVEPHVVYAKAASAIVLVDATTMRPRRMSDRERDAWAAYVDEPVEFTRR